MPLSEYKRFMEALKYYNESYDLAFEDAMADKLKDLLGADYYNNVYVPFKNKIASKIKIGEDEDGKPIMGENPDLKLKQPKYLLDTYSDNPQELKDLIDNYKTKRAIITQKKIDGAKKIGENSDYVCYRITKYPAAQYYGSNTRWCITGRYDGEENRGEYYFNKYIEDEGLDGGYYFFIHKTIPDKKYCILQKKDKKDEEHPLKIHSVWNAQDKPILDEEEFFNLNLPKIKEIPDLDNIDLIKISRGILQSCENEDIDKLKELLDQLSEMEDADINKIKDEDGNTPLYWACRNNNNIEIIKLLLNHGADVNVKDKYGNTPLQWSCKNKNIELAKLLLDHGADVNSENEYENSPLLLACLSYEPNIELIKLLLDHDAYVNVRNKEGETPLGKVCHNSNIEIVKLLLDHGADVNIKDKYDDKPLEIACSNSDLEIVKLLLDHGASVLINKYYNPLEIACDRHIPDLELIELLLEHGAWKYLDADNLPDYITDKEEIEELVLSYLNKNKGRNESIKIRRLYRL